MSSPDMGAANAAVGMYRLMRQGLLDGAALPEIQTDAEQAAHQLLGCANYTAIQQVYTVALDLRSVGDEAMRDAALIVELMADDHLRRCADAVIAARGPIGVNGCAS